MKKGKFLKFFFAILSIGIASIFSYLNSFSLERKFSDEPTIENLRNLFENKKSEDAYRFFTNYGSKLEYAKVHPIAHTVGVILYEKEGVGGIKYCTTDFGFGCYHGFAGVLFQMEGLSALKDFNDACRELNDGFSKCVHGAGHGILGYTGREDLNKALTLCDFFITNSNLGGCLGGVFMEYNNNTTNHVGNIQIRPFTEETFEEPCADGIQEKYKPACYYELPAWWLASFNKKIKEEDLSTKIIELCDRVNVFYKSTCYQGTGNIAATHNNNNAEQIKFWCSRAITPDLFDSCFKEGLGHLDAETLKKACDEGVVTYIPFCEKHTY